MSPSEFYIACSDGDVQGVIRLLPTATKAMIDRQEVDNRSPLRAASWNGHADIIRLLLKRLEFLESNDRGFSFPEEQRDTRNEAPPVYSRIASQNQDKQVWVLDQQNALYFARKFLFGSYKDRGLKRTVKKILKVDIWSTGTSSASFDTPSKEVLAIRSLLVEARETRNSVLLLELYSLEGPFYRNLNRYMAPESRRETVKRVFGKWSGYYAGHIGKNKAFHHLRVSGTTYRGMITGQDDLDQYKKGILICNKAFQSSSRVWEVAFNFATQGLTNRNGIPVIFIHKIIDKRYALNISEHSKFPEEKEVLLLPGILWKVMQVDQTRYPIHIELQQHQFENVF